MCVQSKTFRALSGLALAAILAAAALPALAKDRLAAVVTLKSDELGGGTASPPPASGSPFPATVLTPDNSSAIAVARDRGVITVTVDRAKIVRLPERAQTVIVGNPAIADVSLQKNGIVVLTGKSYGLTNVIALDAGGTVLAESTLSVQAASESVVVVQRGMERESYSCTPRCQPSMLLGDSTKYFGEVNAQTTQRNAAATQR